MGLHILTLGSLQNYKNGKISKLIDNIEGSSGVLKKISVQRESPGALCKY